MAHEGLNDEREVAVRCGEVKDDGGEARWMLGLLENDRTSFKEAKTETHDRAKQRNKRRRSLGEVVMCR
jgi:hypothetical protein